jgi:hypothetical protein
MAAKLMVLESRGAASDHEEQIKRDKLLEASTEAVEAARPMLSLAKAVQVVGETHGFVDHKGQEQTLNLFEELVVSVVDLELKSRKGKARYQLGAGTPTFSAAVAKIDKEGVALMKKLTEYLPIQTGEEVE